MYLALLFPEAFTVAIASCSGRIAQPEVQYTLHIDYLNNMERTICHCFREDVHYDFIFIHLVTSGEVKFYVLFVLSLDFTLSINM